MVNLVFVLPQILLDLYDLKTTTYRLSHLLSGEPHPLLSWMHLTFPAGSTSQGDTRLPNDFRAGATTVQTPQRYNRGKLLLFPHLLGIYEALHHGE